MTQWVDTGEFPALRTARRAGLIEQVIDQLREQIVAGTWAIGARIPTEAELAQLTGTSRNTVREARRTLEAGAARLAALHRPPEDVERLRALIAERNAAARRGDVEEQIAL